ncbi:MAG: HAMP domain-containing protein [Myxococcaceae bacterium]
MIPKSLRARLLVAFLVPASVLFLLAGAAGYFASQDVLEDELGRSLSTVAGAAASQVSGPRMLTVEPGDDAAGTRTYRNLLRALMEVREATGARRIVAFDRQGRVRVDTAGDLPTGAEMPELARDRLELERVFERGERAHSQVLFEGSDGKLYLMGYAPIRDEDAGEKVVGAIAVEGSAAFWRPLQRLVWLYGVLVVSTLLALAAVSFGVAQTLIRPLRKLMQAALRIGGGDLSTPVPPERSEEVGTLARELELMRQALESRDRQLKLMLAGVAHEVRNPIGGIELFAGLLAEELGSPGAQDAEARSHVTRILSEIDYLKRIVEDFLAFAREQRVTLQRMDASALMRSAVELIGADADNKGVVLKLTPVGALIDADESLLTAALVNRVK